MGVCNMLSPDFSAAWCNQLTIGVSHPKHLLEDSGVAGRAMLAAKQPPSKCGRTFHAMTFEEAEALEPKLKGCLLTTWAVALHRGLETAKCSEPSINNADVVVLPGYTATECNWPIYGGGNCKQSQGDTFNTVRGGRICRGHGVLRAIEKIQTAIGKHVVVLENSPNGVGDKYDLPEEDIYRWPHLSWALVASNRYHYRPGVDISVPPGPSTRCKITGHHDAFTKRFGTSLSDKKYLASFKGSMSIHYSRDKARKLLHDGKKVIIADSGESRWDFDELLSSSVFSLILRGDSIMTTRVSEAVCSGGIPVLVTDSWIPPFNEAVPWETFGLKHDEEDLRSLVGMLESVPEAQRNKLRAVARNVCERYFETIDRHAVALAASISNLKVRR